MVVSGRKQNDGGLENTMHWRRYSTNAQNDISLSLLKSFFKRLDPYSILPLFGESWSIDLGVPWRLLRGLLPKGMRRIASCRMTSSVVVSATPVSSYMLMKPPRIATHQGVDKRGDDADRTLSIFPSFGDIFWYSCIAAYDVYGVFILPIQCSGRLLVTLQGQLIQNVLLSGLRIS
jgi:hypothetical protein